MFNENRTRQKRDLSKPKPIAYHYGMDATNNNLLTEKRRMREIKRQADEGVRVVDELLMRMDQLERQGSAGARSLIEVDSKTLNKMKQTFQKISNNSKQAMTAINGELEKKKKKYIKTYKETVVDRG